MKCAVCQVIRIRFYALLMHLPVLLLAVSAMNALRGVFMLFSESAAHTAVTGGLMLVFRERHVLASVLILAALGTVVATYRKGRADGVTVLLCIPQAALMMMVGAGIIAFAALGHYADGVARPPVFILVDQLSGVVLAVGYFINVAQLFYWKRQ